MPAARPESRCTPRRGSSKVGVSRGDAFTGVASSSASLLPRADQCARPSAQLVVRACPLRPARSALYCVEEYLVTACACETEREGCDACRRERAGQRLLIREQSRLRTRQRKRHRAATRLGALGHGVLGLRGGEEGGAVARGRAEGGVSGRARGMTRRGRREGARRLYSPARPGAAGARPSAPRGSSASASWRSAPGARPRWPARREGGRAAAARVSALVRRPPAQAHACAKKRFAVSHPPRAVPRAAPRAACASSARRTRRSNVSLTNEFMIDLRSSVRA